MLAILVTKCLTTLYCSWRTTIWITNNMFYVFHWYYFCNTWQSIHKKGSCVIWNLNIISSRKILYSINSKTGISFSTCVYSWTESLWQSNYGSSKLHDVLCWRYYVDRIVSSFSHKIQSWYYGGNRSVSIEEIALEHLSDSNQSSSSLTSESVSRQAVFSVSLVPTQPYAPPPCLPPVTSMFSSTEFPSRALVISPSISAPPAPLSAGGACPVGGSETSLTARLWQAPANAWLAAPNSAHLGAPAPGVLLPDCAAGSTWKSWGGGKKTGTFDDPVP